MNFPVKKNSLSVVYVVYVGEPDMCLKINKSKFIHLYGDNYSSV